MHVRNKEERKDEERINVLYEKGEREPIRTANANDAAFVTSFV